MKSIKAIKGDEHIICCLSTSPSSTRVVHAAGKMAIAFGGVMTAIFVETPSFKKSSVEERKRLSDNMRLAEEYGAQIVTLYGDDPAVQIAEYANASGATKIVLGMSPSFHGLLPQTNSIVKKLRSNAKDTDLYVIPERVSYYRLADMFNTQEKYSREDLLKAILILLICTGIGFLFFHSPFSTWNVVMVYILGVISIALLTTGRSYSMASSMCAVLLYNFFFTEPLYSLKSDYDSIMTFAVMFIVGFISSTLATRVKEQAISSAHKAYRTDVLLETSQKLQKAEDDLKILDVTAKQLSKLTQCDVIFYPVEDDGTLKDPLVYPINNEDTMENYISDFEKQIAGWVVSNNENAGINTEVASNSLCEYFAIRGTQDVLVVAGLALTTNIELDTFEKSLIQAILDECGSILEKYLINKKKQEMEEKAKQEALRANLLRSISHDLRTPLTSITGNAGMLIDENVNLPLAKRMEMYNAIYDDATWLNDLVENLLAITRIDNGQVNIKKEIELIDDIINEAMAHLDRNGKNHQMEVEITDELMFVEVDGKLIAQVIVNLMNNAIKYTPEGSHIKLHAYRDKQEVCVAISDDGDGIKDSDKEQIFTMFYTAKKERGDNRRGLGLGLALCNSIIGAHDGKIMVEDNKPKGTVFTFRLPLAEVNINE